MLGAIVLVIVLAVLPNRTVPSVISNYGSVDAAVHIMQFLALPQGLTLTT